MYGWLCFAKAKSALSIVTELLPLPINPAVDASLVVRHCIRLMAAFSSESIADVTKSNYLSLFNLSVASFF
jgi:hypothetical protein